MDRISPALVLVSLAAACVTPAPPEIPVASEFREIAQLEDARSTGGGALEEMLAHADPKVRARAATALGRMPWPEHGSQVTRALLGALFDADAGVRAAAAFALGMRRDPAAGDKLLFVAVDHHEADSDPLVRARAVEALSKLDRPGLREASLVALRDGDERVRAELVTGAHRWSREEESADLVDRKLVEHLGHENKAEVVWRTLFALQRRAAPAAKTAFIEYSRSPRDLERLYAVRGLKSLAPDVALVPALEEATRDSDWRVVCEALVGLGACPGQGAGALRASTRHANAHVRRSAWEAIGAQAATIETLEDPFRWMSRAFDAAELDASKNVMGAYHAALDTWQNRTGAAQLSLPPFKERLETASVEELVALAGSLGDSRDPGAAPALGLLAGYDDLRVAGAALMAVGKHPSDQVRELLHGHLSHPDNGLRLAAVLGLTEMPDASDLGPLDAAYRSSEGDIGPEVRFNALRAIAAVGGDEAKVILLQGLADDSAFVRRVAREELEQGWPDVSLTAASIPARPVEAAHVPWAGEDFPAYERNPRVAIETTAGTMEFELFPAETPVHVHSFLTLAQRGHYDGTLFHRVVPDFVIQGGDYRGDGNGGTTYRGADSLRHEIGPRKYVRGSLGMPRNEDRDSGGSQIFVTHRPTPHLDGRYTIFGELREGFDVLDAVEVGDRILRVRRTDGGAR